MYQGVLILGSLNIRIPLDVILQYELILKNISKLMTNFSLRDWEVLPSSSEVH